MSLHKTYIIDDDAIYLFGMRILMKEIGFSQEVSEFTNAEDALDTLNQEIQEGISPPSVIFLDLNMPIMDGWDFLDAFEEWPKEVRQNSRVYVISSSINPADQERSRKYSSVQGYLIKPLKEEVLRDIFNSEKEILS